VTPLLAAAKGPHIDWAAFSPFVALAAGGTVVLLVGLLLAVQFGRQIYANWEIGQRAGEIEAQIAQIEEENARLQAELQYLRSDAYISSEARRLENLGEPGERVLIIPPGAEAPLPPELLALEAPKPFLDQWIELFFGPGS
jgi:cell division protein FtsB